MEIQNLYKNSIDLKSHNERFKELDDIESRFKNILKKENINHLDISIYIDKMRTKVKPFNAQAMRIENDSYEIGFCPQLFTLLDGLSIELTNKYKDYFSEVDKKKFYDKNNRQKLQSYIYQYFTNHVFYHELFHIIRGHLKYLQNTESLNVILEYEETCQQNIDKLYLEIDADKYAFINSVIGEFNTLDNICKLGFNFNEVFYIIFISINELFYILHLLQKEPMIRKGHPILYDRVILFNHHFMEVLNQDKIKNILVTSNIIYDEINRLNELCVSIFTQKYKFEDLFYSCKVVDLIDEYYNFIRDVQLDSYSYNIEINND